MSRPRTELELQAEPAKPRRMTLSDVVDRLTQRGGQGSASSVSLTRNAKGQTQIEVVVRAGEAEEVETAEAARELAERIYDDLCAKYPTAEGNVRNDADAGTSSASSRAGTSAARGGSGGAS